MKKVVIQYVLNDQEKSIVCSNPYEATGYVAALMLDGVAITTTLIEPQKEELEVVNE